MSVTERAKDQFVDGGNPGVGKAIVYGAIGGVCVAFLGVGSLCLLAVWSGLGFGFMFGGIMYVTKLEALDDAERKAARQAITTPDDERPTARPKSESTTLA
jgi:hypothetical protein